jgi:hypothetical protein
VGRSKNFLSIGGWTVTLVKKKGKSPHKYRPMEKRKRPRGSHPTEILEGIYQKGATFICPITGEDPAQYFLKYKQIWIPQRIHYPISYAELSKMGVEDKNAIQYVMFASPNGHNMLDNHRNGIITLDKNKAETCHTCGINSWDMFQKHKKVLKMENHHVNKFGTFLLCPTCHAATEDHSVNVDKNIFPAEKFAELLNAGVLNLSTLHFQLKKYSPKLTKEAIQIKFYAMGLHRIYDRKHIPIPSSLRKYFQNNDAKKFFEVI